MSGKAPSPPASRVPAGRVLAVVGLAGSLGLGAALAMPEPAAQAAAPAPVALGSERVELSGPPADALARQLATRYLEGGVDLLVGDRRYPLRHAELGTRVDLTRLTGLLRSAADPRSAMRRLHGQLGSDAPLALPMPAQLDTASTVRALSRIKERVDRPAQDARVDPRQRRVVPAQPGELLDVYATLERLDAALARGAREEQAVLLPLAPRRQATSFASLRMQTVLGDFRTPYSRQNQTQSRIQNLQTAAEHVDGYVIAPGEVFDFNAVVGNRTRSNGFELATVISDGELVDGMGGGTCQIASTLHAAVFFAGLPVLERHPHSRPSYYIRMGLDAAVAYGSLNFRFRNDRSFPLVVELRVSEGWVYAALHGESREQRVSLLRRVDTVLPFDEKVVEDAGLPSGLRILSQRGIPGFELTHFRVLENLQSRVAVRESIKDRYPPTTQIWRVGTGGELPPDFSLPKSDAHPEYMTDEFLVVTQGPGIEGESVKRTPGRTGEPGWTVREGMGSSPSPTAAPTP
jgi:vancomycin resistance protein YoaR